MVPKDIAAKLAAAETFQAANPGFRCICLAVGQTPIQYGESTMCGTCGAFMNAADVAAADKRPPLPLPEPEQEVECPSDADEYTRAIYGIKNSCIRASNQILADVLKGT